MQGKWLMGDITFFKNKLCQLYHKGRHAEKQMQPGEVRFQRAKRCIVEHKGKQKSGNRMRENYISEQCRGGTQESQGCWEDDKTRTRRLSLWP